MPYKDPEKQKQAQHQSYLRNKDKIVAKTRNKRQRLRDRVKKELHTPCEDCGYYHPAAMDFHHIDPETKTPGGMNKLIESCADWLIIVDEANKCCCLCSNCHRIRHAKER